MRSDQKNKTILNNTNIFLNNILDSIADPVFVKDDKYCFVVVNNALCKILGIDRQNIIGKTLGESLPKDQMEHFLEVDKKVFESGQQNTSEEKLTGKNNKILTIITKKTRFIDKKGNKFLVGVIRDVTEQKENERKLKEKIEEAEKMNKLMVGRELKMIELKEKIKQLENHPLSKNSSIKTWSEKFQEGVNLEESVITQLKDTYITEIEKSVLSNQTKKEAISLIELLVNESQKHKSLLISLVEKENGK